MLEININKQTIQLIADAIRKNGLKQTQGRYKKVNIYGIVEEACAIGQASENLDIRPVGIRNALQVAYKSVVQCPTDPGICLSAYIDVMVIHLNDEHHWTFEQIADFLDGIADGI